MTTPNTGDSIQYWPGGLESWPCEIGVPLPAVVQAVRANGMMDLAITDATGVQQSMHAVAYVPPEDIAEKRLPRLAGYGAWA